MQELHGRSGAAATALDDRSAASPRAAFPAPSVRRPTSALDYEILRYRREFRHDLVALQRYFWDANLARNSAYFAWKFEVNPYLREPIIYVALHGDKVVGMVSVLGGDWRVGPDGAVAPCYSGCDLLIAPEHRGRGLFHRMRRVYFPDVVALGYEYEIGIHVSPANYAGSVRTGWKLTRSFGAMRWETVPAKLRRHVGRLVRKARGRSARTGNERSSFAPFRSFDAAAARVPGGRVTAHISAASDPRPADMARLVARLGPDHRIRHARNEVFFDWRFRDPRAEHRFLYWGDVELEGYLIVRARPGDSRRDIRIVDWEGTSAKIRRELLAAALDVGRFENLTVWSETMPEGTPDLLREAGFKPSDTSVLYRKTGARLPFPGLMIRPTRDEMLAGDWRIGGLPVLDLSSWAIRPTFVD